MNAEFVSLLFVPVYLLAGTAGIALLMNWALKRFGSPGQPSSKMAALKSKKHDWQKNGSVSPPRSDHERARPQKTSTAFATFK